MAGFAQLMEKNAQLQRRVEALEAARPASTRDDVSHRALQEDLSGLPWGALSHAACIEALNSGTFAHAISSVCCDDSDQGEDCNDGVPTASSHCNAGCATLFWPTYGSCIKNHPDVQMSGITYNQATKIARACPSQQEMGDCSQAQLSDWIQGVSAACCADASNCARGYPVACDVGCATVFRPVYERCVEPNLNADGTAKATGPGIGDLTTQMIADAFRAALGGVPADAWISLGHSCPSINDGSAAPHTQGGSASAHHDPSIAKIYNVNFDTTDFSSRRLQATDAEEIRWDTSASAVIALSRDVPACTEDRKGYFLAATIDQKDTMLFCAHNNDKMAWEGFSGLGGFFGQSLSALYEQIGGSSAGAAGTFFVTLKFGDMEQAEGTIEVSNAQTCFIAGNASTPDLTQWSNGDTPSNGILPEIKGPSNVAALRVTSGGNLRIEGVSVGGRRSSSGPAGLHVQSGGRASIDKCSFEDLLTVTREGQSGAVVRVENADGDDLPVLKITTSRFIRCGPIAVWSARPLLVSDSLFVQNGGTTDMAAAISLHNASRPFQVSSCNFVSNTGDAIYIDAAHLVLSRSNFSSDTDLQGTAARLHNGAHVEATYVKITKYSEFDLGAAEDQATFQYCEVENSVDQQHPYQPMQQRCHFDASAPTKYLCDETDRTTIFSGPVKVANQVHLQFQISEDTAPLKLITVRTGYTFNISGDEPVCRDDPAHVLAKFATTDPSNLGAASDSCSTITQDCTANQFCTWIKSNIQSFKVSLADHSDLDCNKTLEFYDQYNIQAKWFKGLFSTDPPFDGPPYDAPPYDDDTRRDEYRHLTLRDVCRFTCNACDGFAARAQPAAADLEPRFLVDAVFDVQQGGKLSLYNVAIRDGYNMGEQPSFEDFGNPFADPPVAHPAYTPPTDGTPLLCGQCPDTADKQLAFIQQPTSAHIPQTYTPQQCPACDPTADGSGRPVPAVNLQPGGVLEAGFSQLANPTKPEWGWLVRSCSFQKRTGTILTRTTDICQTAVSTGPEQRGVYADTTDAEAGDCLSVLEVGAGETISLTLTRKPPAPGQTYDGIYAITIYDGDRDSDQLLKPTTVNHKLWTDGDVVNVTSSSSNRVLIKRSIVDTGTTPGAKPDWQLNWESHWKLDFSCNPVPPSDTDVAPLMGPATIGKDGVKFVKVESSNGQALNLGGATVRRSERVIIFGDTTNREDMVTVRTRFVVEQDASLTLKNMRIDVSDDDRGDEEVPALLVDMNASVTVQNCDVLTQPSIHLPSGDFSFQSTKLFPFNDPVTWNSGSINFLFQSWSNTNPLTQTIWLYENIVIPNDGVDSMNNTVHVSAGQDIALRGPRTVDLHVYLEGYIHVCAGGSVTIQYLRLRASRTGSGLSSRPANALVTVEQDAWVSFDSVQRLQPDRVNCVGHEDCVYSWIVQDWQNYGYKVVGRSSTGQNSLSSLNITGPRFIGQNTTVVRLFSQQQDMVGGVISLRPEGLFGPDPQTTEEMLLSRRFELLDRECAIFIGLCTASGRNDMTLLPTALDLLVPGAYYVRWELEDDATGTIRGGAGNSLALHVHDSQHLMLNSSTTDTQVQVDGQSLTVDRHASLETQRINFPALNPANVYVYGTVDTDACFMVTMDQRNTIGDDADWRCIDDPMMSTNVHCRYGQCTLQDTTNPQGSCGDHVAQLSGGEACDYGHTLNSNAPATQGMDKSSVCRPNCQRARCGDGVVDPVDEQCDDGDANFVCNLAASVDTTLPGFPLYPTMYPSRYGICDRAASTGGPSEASVRARYVAMTPTQLRAECNTVLGRGSSVCTRGTQTDMITALVAHQRPATGWASAHSYCGGGTSGYETGEPASAEAAWQCVHQWRPDNRGACDDTNPECAVSISARIPVPGNPCLRSSGTAFDLDIVSQCRATCESFADAQIPPEPDPAICVKSNSLRPDTCRPNCQFPKCGDGVKDDGDPGGRWSAEECDPGDPNADPPIPPDPPTSRCSRDCVACLPENDDADQLQLVLQDVSYAYRPYNVSLCADLPQLPFTVSIPSTHVVGIVCAQQDCQIEKKVSMHFDIAGSLYLRLIEISAQTASTGGAIAMTQLTATAQIEASLFQHNHATDNNGGALSVPMGFVTVVNTQFVSNAAAQKGGAVYVGVDGSMRMSQVTFRGNTATQAGGAIFIDVPSNPELAAPVLVLHGAVWGSKSEANTAASGGAIFDQNTFHFSDDGSAPTDATYPSGGH